jgi:hypothetical protein
MSALEMYSMPDQAADYHILGPHLGPLIQHLNGLEGKNFVIWDVLFVIPYIHKI